MNLPKLPVDVEIVDVVKLEIAAEIHNAEIYRGSYMSAHVLLNLLNELGKINKMRGLPGILSLFRNEFNKFNNTGARMLDYIYHMTLKYLKIALLCECVKT